MSITKCKSITMNCGNQIIELWPDKFKTSYFNRVMITGLRLFITFCFGGKDAYLCTFVLKLRAKI